MLVLLPKQVSLYPSVSFSSTFNTVQNTLFHSLFPQSRLNQNVSEWTFAPWTMINWIIIIAFLPVFKVTLLRTNSVSYLIKSFCLGLLFFCSKAYFICHFVPLLWVSVLFTAFKTQGRHVVAINKIFPHGIVHWHVTQKATQLHCAFSEKF